MHHAPIEQGPGPDTAMAAGVGARASPAGLAVFAVLITPDSVRSKQLRIKLTDYHGLTLNASIP